MRQQYNPRFLLVVAISLFVLSVIILKDNATSQIQRTIAINQRNDLADSLAVISLSYDSLKNWMTEVEKRYDQDIESRERLLRMTRQELQTKVENLQQQLVYWKGVYDEEAQKNEFLEVNIHTLKLLLKRSDDAEKADSIKSKNAIKLWKSNTG